MQSIALGETKCRTANREAGRHPQPQRRKWRSGIVCLLGADRPTGVAGVTTMTFKILWPLLSYMRVNAIVH